VISLKAETHNFPTTVEPSTERQQVQEEKFVTVLQVDKVLALAGTAVYMTSYSRLEENRPWENGMAERKWLYQTQWIFNQSFKRSI
jgi:phosphoribosylformylglycinamidine synthase